MSYGLSARETKGDLLPIVIGVYDTREQCVQKTVDICKEMDMTFVDFDSIQTPTGGYWLSKSDELWFAINDLELQS